MRGTNILHSMFGALDIETSTEHSEEGKPTHTFLSYGVMSEYLIAPLTKELRTLRVTRFRTWEQLDEALQRLSNEGRQLKKQIIIYVHNLAYEFEYLQRNLYQCRKMTAITAHKPIRCTFKELPYIQFRCTYQLTQMSLKRMGELVGVPKLESEYRYIRPGDNVTEEEWRYCERDTLIPAVYIYKIIQGGTGLPDIPLTATGWVRKDFRLLCDEEKCIDWDLCPSSEQYRYMTEAFYGAITISNPRHTGIILSDVSSFDETSAYPFVLMTEKYPRTVEGFLSQGATLPSDFIATIRFTAIKSRYDWGWLSVHRAIECDGAVNIFNGKIIEANSLVMTVCDVDLKNINKTYTYSKKEIIGGIALGQKQDMPECYKRLVIQYMERKSALKEQVRNDPDNTELLFEYAQAKARVNSIWGMCAQKLTQKDFIVHDSGEWEAVEGGIDALAEDCRKKSADGKPHLRRSFLFGVYVTAYARANLINGIIQNCPSTFVYADTDSIKYIDNSKGTTFTDTNKRMPQGVPNSIKCLGVFEFEHCYERFITWGAKKYATVTDGTLSVTVAGLPRKGWEPYLPNGIEDFKPVTVFRNVKLAHKYLSGGVALYPTDYTLDITENDAQVLNDYEKLRKMEKDKI